MSSLENDRRIQQRLLRRRALDTKEMDKALESLPDLAENVQVATPEELEGLREQLSSERALRAERLERAVARAAAPTVERPKGPVEPLTEADL